MQGHITPNMLEHITLNVKEHITRYVQRVHNSMYKGTYSSRKQ